MNANVAILELKYGNIYGGYPNFFAISEISLLVFEGRNNKIFIETWSNKLDVDFVSVYSKVNELGHTLSRVKEVVNMRTGRTRPFMEDFKLDDRALQYTFKKLRPVQGWIKKFLLTNFKKYGIRDIITFDGRRDIFLCERSGINFDRMNIVDLQRELNKETDYLFSLNKLSVIANVRVEGSYLRSNNLEYWLHPIAAKQLMPRSAAWDAARLLMIHNEYREYHDDFLMKAALLLNKIQSSKTE
ncbi:MAG: hypothetical protein KDC43_08525 [Saprospiraceae bacterium]|nr:hypothetical protein [Saprospiraceae bacterium]MCB0623939.1 hypothetical protein [Saprospiraceae bacterium]MCB0677825.1 hypothetical protein [Saprospiraceae bacterium]MCB0681433.1 hypothetical protein [Saprospiraceae bacterium]